MWHHCPMRISPVLLLPLILTGTAAPLSASQDQPVDKPVTDQAVSAGDVVRTPFSDLNLRKGEIPELLIRAQADPYGVAGLRKCGQLTAAIADLDAVLGDDIDLPRDRFDALYDRPHKEITNEGGTLIIIHDADSSEWHFFECLV